MAQPDDSADLAIRIERVTKKRGANVVLKDVSVDVPRGQVVAVGPQTVADRRFDVAVIELFGDAQAAEAFTRVDGAIVVDRASGVLLRLDLRSAQPPFSLQRRLVRVEAAPG